MKKTIISYNETGIIIEVTMIKANEHKQARNEIEKFQVFKFDSIDADNFQCSTESPNEDTLAKLESLGYTF